MPSRRLPPCKRFTVAKGNSLRRPSPPRRHRRRTAQHLEHDGPVPGPHPHGRSPACYAVQPLPAARKPCSRGFAGNTCSPDTCELLPRHTFGLSLRHHASNSRRHVSPPTGTSSNRAGDLRSAVPGQASSARQFPACIRRKYLYVPAASHELRIERRALLTRKTQDQRPLSYLVANPGRASVIETDG